MAGAEVVDHARLCFRLFSLLGDSGTVGGTCSGTASSDGDWDREICIVINILLIILVPKSSRRNSSYVS